MTKHTFMGNTIQYLSLQEYGFGGVPETPSFLPEDLDTTDLLDITPMGASYKQYLDPVTNKVHDGQKYYEQMTLEYTEGEVNRVVEEVASRLEMDHLRKTVTTMLHKGDSK